MKTAITGILIASSAVLTFAAKVPSPQIAAASATAPSPAGGFAPLAIQSIPPNSPSTITARISGSNFDGSYTAYWDGALAASIQSADPNPINRTRAWRVELHGVPALAQTGGIGFFYVYRTFVVQGGTPTLQWLAGVGDNPGAGDFVLSGTDYNCSGSSRGYTVSVSP